MEGHLTGSYLVRAYRPAFQEARKLLPRQRDFAELRRHALKLRFWPENHPETEDGQVLDLDWSWVRSLSGKNIGELRIGDTIAGHDNLRVIFFVPQEKTKPPIIWVLAAFQKKRDDFSKA
ncbi:MAG: hypothetical protein GX621_14460 [Pirellulaceae bacterium]|nr:hypothetical protein [Pirellulaceae bacterium]